VIRDGRAQAQVTDAVVARRVLAAIIAHADDGRPLGEGDHPYLRQRQRFSAQSPGHRDGSAKSNASSGPPKAVIASSAAGIEGKLKFSLNMAEQMIHRPASGTGGCATSGPHLPRDVMEAHQLDGHGRHDVAVVRHPEALLQRTRLPVSPLADTCSSTPFAGHGMTFLVASGCKELGCTLHMILEKSCRAAAAEVREHQQTDSNSP